MGFTTKRFIINKEGCLGMKRIFLLLVISFLFISCSDKKESEPADQKLTQNESPQKVEMTHASDSTELSLGCMIDVSKLDSTVWTPKEYTINYIAEDLLHEIDPATVQQLLNCGVLDSTRRTYEVEGELNEHDIHYSYYNMYKLEHYYLLTILEDIEDGPEYSFIGVTINPITDNVIDSKYMLSIWMDQYEANFKIEYQPDNRFDVYKNTKYLYSSGMLDSLEVSNMYCYYVVNDNGKLEETMVDDQYYKCAKLDLDKGLLNEEGRRDNVLYAVLPEFDVKLNDFYYGEEPPSEDVDLFTADHSSDEGNIDLNYTTGGIYGASGSPFSNNLKIVPGDKDFEIIKVEQQYTTTLFFNEDGSGGVFSIQGVDETTSDWVSLKSSDKYNYKTLSKSEMKKFKKPISEKSISAAKKYVSSHGGNVGYSEDVVDAKLRITSRAGGRERVTTLNFDFEYGD